MEKLFTSCIRVFCVGFLCVPLWSGCGDDDDLADAAVDAPAADTQTDTDAPDTAPTDADRPDTALPPLVCTEIPAPARSGTAPRNVALDPQTFDEAVVVAFDADAVGEERGRYPIGVSSGAVNPTRAMVTTRVVGDGASRLRVWRDAEREGDVALVFDETVVVADGGYVHAVIETLAPDTNYTYAFFRDGDPLTARSPIGQFHTAPPMDASVRVRFGATTCTGSSGEPARTNLKPYRSLSFLAAQDIDAVLHLGDMSYNDNAVTRAQYRAEWTETLSQSGYRDLFSSTSVFATWDDHEITNNFDPETLSPVRLASAKDAFFETLPVERGDDGELYRSYRWGETAELFITDARSERRPSTLESDDPVFVSAAQLEFIKQGLLNSEAHFKLVFSSVHISNLPGFWDIASDDRWEGYATQRVELLDFIVDNEIDNVWFLAGDVHLGMVGRLEREGHPHAGMWEITVGPGASGVNPISGLVDAGLFEERDAFPCDQFVFWHGRNEVATVLELDPLADTIRTIFTDVETDEVLFDEALTQGAR